jgi:hypothetical protein
MEATDDIVDFKPNSALSVGTNVFLSGYWRKEQIIRIDIDDSKGKIYTVQDCENGKHLYCQNICFIQICYESLVMHII